ncbi:hypothetical protein ZWY2020_013901 [Hordeum vulgare]|nr:hypothetical protein ZWY2020_013901 [Hordeum vulgare]
MEVTSSFGMWVWTPSPRRIAKAMWCTFVNKAPCGLSSRIRIDEDRPDQWKRGMTFRVLLHIDRIEDFNGAPVLDGGAPISDFRPRVHAPPCHRHHRWHAGCGAGPPPPAIPPLVTSARDKDACHRSDLEGLPALATRRPARPTLEVAPLPLSTRGRYGGAPPRSACGRCGGAAPSRATLAMTTQTPCSRSREERRRSRSRADDADDRSQPHAIHMTMMVTRPPFSSPRRIGRTRDSWRALRQPPMQPWTPSPSRHHNSEAAPQLQPYDADSVRATPQRLPPRCSSKDSLLPETALHSATMKPLPMTLTTPSWRPLLRRDRAAAQGFGSAPNSLMPTSPVGQDQSRGGSGPRHQRRTDAPAGLFEARCHSC